MKYSMNISVSILLVIVVVFELRSIQSSCPPIGPGISFRQSGSSNGNSYCYIRSSDMMDFDAAKDFCETQFNMHLVFFETEDELNYMITSVSGHNMWIGLSSIAGNWYWTYFQTMTGVQASFTNWGSQPETGTQAMSNVNYVWEGVSPSERLYVMCETESSWTATLTGFQPLAVLTMTTTTTIARAQTMTTAVSKTKICKAKRSSEVTSFRRKYFLVRLGTGLVESELIASSRTLLTCIKDCLLDDTCCDVGYSRTNEMCYRLILFGIPTSSTAILDCSKVICYRVKD